MNIPFVRNFIVLAPQLLQQLGLGLSGKRIIQNVASGAAITPKIHNTLVVMNNTESGGGSIAINQYVGTPTDGQSFWLLIYATNQQNITWDNTYYADTDMFTRPITTLSGGKGLLIPLTYFAKCGKFCMNGVHSGIPA